MLAQRTQPKQSTAGFDEERYNMIKGKEKGILCKMFLMEFCFNALLSVAAADFDTHCMGLSQEATFKRTGNSQDATDLHIHSMLHSVDEGGFQSHLSLFLVCVSMLTCTEHSHLTDCPIFVRFLLRIAQTAIAAVYKCQYAELLVFMRVIGISTTALCLQMLQNLAKTQRIINLQ